MLPLTQKPLFPLPLAVLRGSVGQTGQGVAEGPYKVPKKTKERSDQKGTFLLSPGFGHKT